MTILDGHVHIRDGEKRDNSDGTACSIAMHTETDRRGFLQRLKEAGVDGAAVISLPPPVFHLVARPRPAEERLENLLFWTEIVFNTLPPIFKESYNKKQRRNNCKERDMYNKHCNL